MGPWCRWKTKCKIGEPEPTEKECKTLHYDGTPCDYYNPKMTFFEAWEKAEDGDKLYADKLSFIVKGEKDILCWDSNPESIPIQKYLFEKEWTIIPKKKKVIKTIVIPKDAENIHLQHQKPFSFGPLTKITYEIDE